MFAKNKKNLKGVTLVELLIVVAIISIFSTIFLVDFSASRAQKDVEIAGKEIAAAFREAQNYALTGNQGVPGTDPCGYELRWSESGSSYTITYQYLNSSARCTQEVIVRTYTLKNGIRFDNTGDFSFSLPHAAVSRTRTATVYKGTAYYSVCISREGLISERAGTNCP